MVAVNDVGNVMNKGADVSLPQTITTVHDLAIVCYDEHAFLAIDLNGRTGVNEW